jgi:hypothetical protein
MPKKDNELHEDKDNKKAIQIEETEPEDKELYEQGIRLKYGFYDPKRDQLADALIRTADVVYFLTMSLTTTKMYDEVVPKDEYYVGLFEIMALVEDSIRAVASNIEYELSELVE